mgnify:CR=1 FL=1
MYRSMESSTCHPEWVLERNGDFMCGSTNAGILLHRIRLIDSILLRMHSIDTILLQMRMIELSFTTIEDDRLLILDANV